MKRKDIVLDLAKLVICAAWADGELCNDEINALKDLLFTLGEISVEDWSKLTMYMESPPSKKESEEILNRVIESLHTAEEKTFALDTLQALFKCDGKVTIEEQKLMNELEKSIRDRSTNLFSSFTQAFKTAVLQRTAKIKSSFLREAESEDYIKNTIYYDLKRLMKTAAVRSNKTDDELRKICLAVGLLARIANMDNDISIEEKKAMCHILADDWNLSADEAKLLVDISCERTTKGLDYFRLTCGYFECTDIPERKAFLKTLFKVANAANKTDNEEIEEIRRISHSLKLAHQDFIDAKLTISREDRNGL
ncbi:MAG: TerB family tellurite resistance protein [Pontiellaceae bacterium]|nr:TerB family tellurite resistance protein [Pontiellaceae bacterium]